jgi:uncharacterized protein (TIGR03437 family)
VVAGATDSPAFPVTADALQGCIGNERSFSNAFLLKLNASGSGLLYSTYLGGNVRDQGFALALDPAGNAYVSGMSDSTDFGPTPGAIGEPRGQAFVSKIDLSAPTPAGITCVANTASMMAGAVAPGEIVTVLGSGFGPASPQTAQLDAEGRLPAVIAGVRLLFDGLPVPLISVSATRILAVVPNAVAFRTSTRIEVEHQGRVAAAKTAGIAVSSPALFTLNGRGIGRVAAINQDGTINSPENPAPRGTFITVFGNGAGLTAAVEGRVATEARRLPVLVSLVVSQNSLPVVYAGPSPGQVDSLLQINVLIPVNAPTGAEIPVSLILAGRTIAQRVTVSIR